MTFNKPKSLQTQFSLSSFFAAFLFISFYLTLDGAVIEICDALRTNFQHQEVHYVIRQQTFKRAQYYHMMLQAW